MLQALFVRQCDTESQSAINTKEIGTESFNWMSRYKSNKQLNEDETIERECDGVKKMHTERER